MVYQVFSRHDDVRLERVEQLLFSRLVSKKTVCLKKLAGKRSDEVKFGRFLRNEKVSPQPMIADEQSRTNRASSGKHVLSIMDTTEINFQHHADKVQGLGTVGNGKDKGVFLHPALVIDADSGGGLSFSSIHYWNRFKKRDKNYPKLPIEEKESYRWITTADAGKKNLSKASCVTFVSDRESDIYEFLDRIPDKKHHIIVRSRCDRLLKKPGSLHGCLLKEPVAKTSILHLPRTKKRKTMSVEVDLRFTTVDVAKPRNSSDKSASASVRLSVVQVKEKSRHKDAINWTLLSTHPVNTLEEAERIVKWYKQRWQVEQLFRTLKSQGLDVESSQLETEKSLTKLVIIALNAAVTIMQLVLARDGDTEQETKVLFNKDEITCLTALLLKVEGRTQKQKNPFPPDNLAWASWIIGRLGGWMGYKSEGPIGPIVMGRGLERFYAVLNGFFLLRDTCTE